VFIGFGESVAQGLALRMPDDDCDLGHNSFLLTRQPVSLRYRKSIPELWHSRRTKKTPRPKSRGAPVF
jgi:hypothetical protein